MKKLFITISIFICSLSFADEAGRCVSHNVEEVAFYDEFIGLSMTLVGENGRHFITAYIAKQSFYNKKAMTEAFFAPELFFDKKDECFRLTQIQAYNLTQFLAGLSIYIMKNDMLKQINDAVIKEAGYDGAVKMNKNYTIIVKRIIDISEKFEKKE